MKPIDSFHDSWKRANYLLRLYNLLKTSLTYKTTKPWKENFKNSPIYPRKWKQKDDVMRAGHQEVALLAIRNPSESEWTKDHFGHEWLSELLCAALVFAVSAMDRYFHDFVVDKSLTLLSRRVDKIPPDLSKFKISLGTAEVVARKALKSRKVGQAIRPRTILKEKFREELHRKTFQTYDEICDAFKMLGLQDNWSKVTQELRKPLTNNEVKEKLKQIVDRRNKIVHEGNKVREKRPRRPKRFQIDFKKTHEDIDWIQNLVDAIDKVIT